MSQHQPLKDWHIDGQAKSVQHTSGLTIQFSDKNAPPHNPGTLDIRGIENLAGTPWAHRSNLLVEAGISLLASL